MWESIRIGWLSKRGVERWRVYDVMKSGQGDSRDDMGRGEWEGLAGGSFDLGGGG